MNRLAAQAWLLAFGLCLCACQSTPTRDAIDILRDDEASLAQRLPAVQQVALDDAGWEALTELAWTDGRVLRLRVAALDRLLNADPQRVARDARPRLMRTTSRPFLQTVSWRTVQHRVTPMSDALVLSWARTDPVAPDKARPEHVALVNLHQQDARLTLWDMLEAPSIPIRESVAAWTVLCRIQDENERRERLTASTSGNALVLDLQQAAESLDELPRNTEQYVLWLAVREDADLLSRGSALEGVALRHLAVLQEADMALPRVQLNHAPDERTDLGVHGRAIDSSWATQHPHLSDADRQALAAILHHLQQPEIVAALFDHADADLADTGAEHGGLLRWQNNQLRAVPYPPTAAMSHDRIYAAPAELILDLPLAWAHYHFHAQAHDLAAHASPGEGDLRFADRFGCTCLVFTFLDADTLNADLYLPGRRVIDLGRLRRP